MAHNIRWKLLIIGAVAGIAALVGILLFPMLDRVRENAQRVNDLSNLHAIYKAASHWGLDPGDSFRSSVPPSLDQLVKEKKITKEMLVSYTGKPIEYYPAGDNEDNPVMLVSYGNHGRNFIRCSGSGMWVDDGTPEAAKLDRQLARRKKQQVRNLFGAEQPPLPQLDRQTIHPVKNNASTNDVKQSYPVVNSKRLIEIARHNTLSNNLVLLKYYYGNESNVRKLGGDDQIKNATYRLIDTDIDERYVDMTIHKTIHNKVISTNTVQVLSSVSISSKCMTNYAKHKNVLSNNYETMLEKRTVQGIDVLIPIEHVLKSLNIDMSPFIK